MSGLTPPSTDTAYTTNRSVDSVSGFTPIQGLFQPDGDLTLVFLSANDVQYANVVNDVWYAAHQPSGIFQQYRESDDSSKLYTFLADHAASVLGCKSQYEVCKPQDDAQQSCSQSESSADVWNELSSTADQELFAWMWYSIPSVLYVIELLGVSSLTSRFKMETGISGPLPDDQWQQDVENWHNIALARVQGQILERAAGPTDANILNSIWQGPQNDLQKSYCKNQVRRLPALRTHIL